MHINYGTFWTDIWQMLKIMLTGFKSDISGGRFCEHHTIYFTFQSAKELIDTVRNRRPPSLNVEMTGWMICLLQCTGQSDSFTGSKARWQQRTGVPTGARLDARLHPVGSHSALPCLSKLLVQPLSCGEKPSEPFFALSSLQQSSCSSFLFWPQPDPGLSHRLFLLKHWWLVTFCTALTSYEQLSYRLFSGCTCRRSDLQRSSCLARLQESRLI